jgi:uncharacterized membrane protein YkoI
MNLPKKIMVPMAAFALVAAGAVTSLAVQSHAATSTDTSATTSTPSTSVTAETSTAETASATDPADTDQIQDQQGGQDVQDVQDANDGQSDPAEGGHVGKNGTKEQLLTGDAATKAQAAALAAVPGGTIQRVENDAEGATYEAHMTKADGSRVTVQMDANYNVTSTETGQGR